jgi:DNA-binding MarR family transcriptional regulator
VTKGLLETKQDPVDRRYVQLFITNQANAIVEKLLKKQEDFMNILLETITDSEKEFAKAIVEKIINNINNLEGSI